MADYTRQPSRDPSAPQNVAKIVSQVQQTEQDATGQYVRGARVYFTTTSGQPGSVFVPQSMYTEVNVRAAVAAAAGVINALHNAQV